MSGGPNMGLVIFMQILSQICTVFNSVCHIGSCEAMRFILPSAHDIGVFARVLTHVPANKSQRRDGYPWDDVLTSAEYTIWVGAHQ
ncbi:hypothetical protein HaLaN_01565, partial [Haematococcus lacustris]